MDDVGNHVMGQDMKIVALPLPAEDAFFGAFVDLGNVLRCEKTVDCARFRKPSSKDISMNKLKSKQFMIL